MQHLRMVAVVAYQVKSAFFHGGPIGPSQCERNVTVQPPLLHVHDEAVELDGSLVRECSGHALGAGQKQSQMVYCHGEGPCWPALGPLVFIEHA